MSRWGALGPYGGRGGKRKKPGKPLPADPKLVETAAQLITKVRSLCFLHPFVHQPPWISFWLQVSFLHPKLTPRTQKPGIHTQHQSWCGATSSEMRGCTARCGWLCWSRGNPQLARTTASELTFLDEPEIYASFEIKMPVSGVGLLVSIVPHAWGAPAAMGRPPGMLLRPSSLAAPRINTQTTQDWHPLGYTSASLIRACPSLGIYRCEQAKASFWWCRGSGRYPWRRQPKVQPRSLKWWEQTYGIFVFPLSLHSICHRSAGSKLVNPSSASSCAVCYLPP
jgi:hypothetical protein